MSTNLKAANNGIVGAEANFIEALAASKKPETLSFPHQELAEIY